MIQLASHPLLRRFTVSAFSEVCDNLKKLASHLSAFFTFYRFLTTVLHSDFFQPQTGNFSALPFAQFRHFLRATRLRVRAALVQRATAGQIERAGQFAAEFQLHFLLF